MAITFAPAAVPSWIIAVPTALAPPTTSSVSPACSCARCVHREVAGVERQRERGGLDVVELGRRVEHAVHPASAKSATPPNDWLVLATTRRPIHSSAPAPADSTTPHTSMPIVNGT